MYHVQSYIVVQEGQIYMYILMHSHIRCTISVGVKGEALHIATVILGDVSLSLEHVYVVGQGKQGQYELHHSIHT